MSKHKQEGPEPWVDGYRIAEHLNKSYQWVWRMTKAKVIPASGVGFGKNKTWLYKISQVDAAIAALQSKTA